MLFSWFKGRAATAERNRKARLLAERAFADAYPSRRLIPGMTSVFHEDAAGQVLQLCYDWGGIPPHRSWWRVFPDDSCCELTLDEASQLRPLPIWR